MVRQPPSIDAETLTKQLEALGIPIIKHANPWNNLFKGKQASALPEPLVIAAPVDEHQVSSAVKVALQHGLRVGVKTGGHHYGCCWSETSSLLLDVGALKHLHLDGTTARIGPGVTAAILYDALDGTGLHFPGPHLSSVACGGFIAGGGNGFGTPLFGAGDWAMEDHAYNSKARSLTLCSHNKYTACDCLICVRIVDGRTGDILTVTLETHPDLWFAMRGAGGFFGVIVEFTIALFQVPANLPSSLAVFAISGSNPPPGGPAAGPTAIVTALEAWARRMPTLPAAIECNAVLCGGGPALDPCLVIASNAFAEANADMTAALVECKDMVPGHAPMVWDPEAVPYRKAMQAIDPTYEFPGVCCYGGVLCFSPAVLTSDVLRVVVDAYMHRTSRRSVVLFAPGFPKTDAPCAAGYRVGCVIIGTYAMWSRTDAGGLADGDQEHIAWADALIAKVCVLRGATYSWLLWVVHIFVPLSLLPSAEAAGRVSVC